MRVSDWWLLLAASPSLASPPSSHRSLLLPSACSLAPLADTRMTSQQSLNDALFQAVRQGSLTDIESLVNRHADVNAVGHDKNTPLHVACSNGRHQCVKLLLDRRAEIDAVGSQNQTPLHAASQSGHYQCVGILLNRGADRLYLDVRSRVRTALVLHRINM